MPYRTREALSCSSRSWVPAGSIRCIVMVPVHCSALERLCYSYATNTCLVPPTTGFLCKRRSAFRRNATCTEKAATKDGKRLHTKLRTVSESSDMQIRDQFVEGADLHERPDSSQSLVLYTHMLCPYAQRSLLTFLYKCVPHEVVHIDLSDKPKWFRQLCKDEALPSTVPAIDYKGCAKTDSLEISRWICENFQGSQFPPLRYESPEDKQQVDRLIAGCSAFASAGLELLAGRTGRSWGIGSNPSPSQWAAFQKELQKLQAELKASGGPFLMGAEVSLADLMYMPFMERFALAMPAFTPYNPCDGSIGQWLEAMRQLECCRKAAPDPDLFLQALKKERSLDFFDFSTYTAYQLHPHLQ